LDGQIYPCFGNWVMNNLSLSFIVRAGSSGGAGGPTNPKNIVHNMQPGMKLSDAIKNTLSTAFPNSKVNVNISDKLVLSNPDYSFHQSIDQYANYIKTLSHSILGTPPKYSGVSISPQGNTINVHDGTKSGGAIQIKYEDLIGQPTWLENNVIQVTTLLRGDVSGATSEGTQKITLPPTLVTMNANQAIIEATGGVEGLSGNYLTFQGTWDVRSVRHVGHFRDPQWNSWITVIEAYQSGGSGGGSSGGGDSGPTTPTPSTGGQQTFAQTGEGSGTGSST
jgi:hypothetical protein